MVQFSVSRPLCLQIVFRQLLGTEEDSSDHVSSDDEDELLGTGKFIFVM